VSAKAWYLYISPGIDIEVVPNAGDEQLVSWAFHIDPAFFDHNVNGRANVVHDVFSSGGRDPTDNLADSLLNMSPQ
jgi:hypothetical protein